MINMARANMVRVFFKPGHQFHVCHELPAANIRLFDCSGKRWHQHSHRGQINAVDAGIYWLCYDRHRCKHKTGANMLIFTSFLLEGLSENRHSKHTCHQLSTLLPLSKKHHSQHGHDGVLLKHMKGTYWRNIAFWRLLNILWSVCLAL